MASDEAAAGGGTTGKPGRLPFDTSVAHQARVYDYFLGGKDNIDADLRDTPAILGQAAQLLDFTKPVAVTLISILHAIPDDDAPHAIVARLLGAVPSGSYLAVSHMGSDLMDPEKLREMDAIWKRMSQQQYTLRSREGMARFFDGTDLVDPGLVRVEEWRPEPGTDVARKSIMWSAVGRKP